MLTSILTTTIVCLSLLSNSADPHSSEVVTQIKLDLKQESASVARYEFEALELYNKSLVDVLVDENLIEPAQSRSIEFVKSDSTDQIQVYHLWRNDELSTTIDSILLIEGEKAILKKLRYKRSYSIEMRCHNP